MFAREHDLGIAPLPLATNLVAGLGISSRSVRVRSLRTALEGCRFVVGGEPGLTLASFFGINSALAAFGLDPVTEVILTGLFAAGQHYEAFDVVGCDVGGDLERTRRLPERWEHACTMRFGSPQVPSQTGQLDCAVEQLPIGPATDSTEEGLHEMTATTG